MRQKLLIYLIFSLIPLGFAPSPAQAQSFLIDALKAPAPSPSASQATPLPQEIQDKRSELVPEIEKAKGELENAPLILQNAVYEYLRNRVSLLESLDLLYEQIQETYQSGQETTKTRDELKKNLAAWKTLGPPKDLKPSVFLLDQARDQLAKQKKHSENFATNLQELQKDLSQAKQESEDLESQRRQVKESLEKNRDTSQEPVLRQALEEIQLKSRIAKEKISLEALEMQNEKVSQESIQLDIQFLEVKLAWLKDHLSFSEEDLNEALRKIGQDEVALNQTLDQSRQELVKVDRLWTSARAKYSQTENPSPALKAEIDASMLERDTLRVKIAISSQQLESLKTLRELWKDRFAFYKGKVPASDLKDWKSRFQYEIEQNKHQEELYRTGMADLRETMAKIREKTSARQDQDPATLPWLDREQSEARGRMSFYLDTIAQQTKVRQFYEQFLDDIGFSANKKTFGERASVIWDKIKGVWYYEITAVDDRPITVGKVVMVLILVVIGFAISRKLSRFLGEKLLPHLGMEMGVIAALQTLSFYLLITFVTLLALYLVNVPLTLFTVLGGAVAIGVGFGSQTIVKNFISGLILLVEHPIRPGDMVEIDGSYGTVDKIGARSTRVHAFNNTHIIIPNSDLLEKKVINWTLFDDRSRATIAIGVSYDSSPREVAKCLRRAVDEHGKVLKTPEPIVCFTEFAENSMNFEIYFWVKMRTMMERKIIESDIRFILEGYLKDAGISISSPQRDITFKNDQVLNIRFRGSEDKEQNSLPAKENDSDESPTK